MNLIILKTSNVLRIKFYPKFQYCLGKTSLSVKALFIWINYSEVINQEKIELIIKICNVYIFCQFSIQLVSFLSFM